MVEKQRGGKHKRIIRHEASTATAEPSVEKKPLLEKTPLSSRPQEKHPGFGVLKGVAGIIALLVIGSAILFNRAGGREAMRGDKKQGDTCAQTTECEKGSICFSFKGEGHRCMATCSPKDPCDPGFTCRTASSSKRKGIRLTEVCVPNAVL